MSLLRPQPAFNAAAIDPAELLRVLTPIDEENKFDAAGMPLSLGMAEDLVNLANWQSGLMNACHFDLQQLENLKENSAETVLPKDMPYYALQLYNRLNEVFPKEAYAKLEIGGRSEWHGHEGPANGSASHVDVNFDTVASFTAILAFPYTTIYYPWLSPEDFYKLKNSKTFRPEDHEIYRPSPGEITLLNDNRHVHEIPNNDKARDEWLRELAAYGPDVSKIVDGEGNVERFVMIALIRLKEEWLEKKCAELAKEIATAPAKHPGMDYE